MQCYSCSIGEHDCWEEHCDCDCEGDDEDTLSTLAILGF